MGLPTKDNKGAKGKNQPPSNAHNSKFIAKPGKQATNMPKKKTNTGSNRGS